MFDCSNPYIYMAACTEQTHKILKLKSLWDSVEGKFYFVLELRQKFWSLVLWKNTSLLESPLPLESCPSCGFFHSLEFHRGIWPGTLFNVKISQRHCCRLHRWKYALIVLVWVPVEIIGRFRQKWPPSARGSRCIFNFLRIRPMISTGTENSTNRAYFQRWSRQQCLWEILVRNKVSGQIPHETRWNGKIHNSGRIPTVMAKPQN